jgi:Chaperone of endosialidase
VSNNAFGDSALSSNTTGSINTAVGDMALFSNTDGSNNTAVGQSALQNSTGNANTAIGGGALLSNTTATGNTAVGVNALQNNTTGQNNIALGAGAGSNVTTASNVIAIGTAGNDVNDSCYIGNIFGATSVNGVGVLVNSNGRLGTTTSSARFKDQIKPMDNASEALYALKPVTFHYKKDFDPAGTEQFGLVAEDVEKVNSDLVVRDERGKPYSVRYDQVNAMLLNEFLKEHKTVQALKSTVQKQETIIARQQKSFQSRLAEQERQIEALAWGLQKVGAQIELSGAKTTLAGNNQ